MKLNQKGFSVVEIIIVIVVIGLLGAIGWLVYDRQNSGKADKQITQTSTSQQEETSKQETKKADSNEGYLVVKDWNLRFKIPSGLTDVKYEIHGDSVAFFAKPSGSSVQYRSDFDKYEDGHFLYATGLLYRSKDATNNENGFATEGKKLGEYYYYTAWSFSGLATGAACVEIYGDSSEANCQAAAKAFQLVNQGDTALLNTIELAQ